MLQFACCTPVLLCLFIRKRKLDVAMPHIWLCRRLLQVDISNIHAFLVNLSERFA